MNAPIPGGSAAFVDVRGNRDSLVPLPSRTPDEGCLHRQVTDVGGDNAFAAQRGHPVYPIRLPARNVSMSIGELSPGASTSDHRHAYESMIYVIKGAGHTLMEGKAYPWRAGDALYVPPWCWHQHVAEPGSEVQYLTATNLPLLLQLGQTVLREEGREASVPAEKVTA